MLIKDIIPKSQLFQITWPLFFQYLVFMLMGATDIFMLSRVSDQAAAGVSVANEVISVVLVTFTIISIGTNVVLAQFLGAKKFEKVSLITSNSVTINLLVGVVLSLLLVMFREPILEFMNLPPSVLEISLLYTLIVGGFIFTEAISETIKASLRAHKKTREVMLVAVVTIMLNILGNSLLIFGLFGFPEMGVAGAAISTVVSRFIGLVIVFSLYHKLLGIPFVLKNYVCIKLDDVKEVLKVGFPAAGEHFIWLASQIVTISFISKLGTDSVVTHYYTMNVMLFIMLFGEAIGAGTAIIIGHLVGAGKKNDAYTQLISSLKWGILITLIIVAIISTIRQEIISIFTKNPDVIRTAGYLLLICLILEPGRSFNLVVNNSLRATGDAFYPVKVALLSMWGISVPLSYILGLKLGMGLVGIWIAFTIDEWLRGSLTLRRWNTRKWETRVLVPVNEKKSV